MDNVCLCEAPRIKAKFRRTWECTICGKPEQPTDTAAPSPAGGVREAIRAAVVRGIADEVNGKPCGDIITKGCEAAEYIHVDEAAAMFIDCIVDEVLLALFPAALSPATPARGGCVVKPLEWSKVGAGYLHRADLYRIEDNGPNWSEDRYWLDFIDQRLGKFGTLEAAQVAAQDHHETRIRSALASPDAKEG